MDQSEAPKPQKIPGAAMLTARGDVQGVIFSSRDGAELSVTDRPPPHGLRYSSRCCTDRLQPPQRGCSSRTAGGSRHRRHLPLSAAARRANWRGCRSRCGRSRQAHLIRSRRQIRSREPRPRPISAWTDNSKSRHKQDASRAMGKDPLTFASCRGPRLDKPLSAGTGAALMPIKMRPSSIL